MWRMTGVYQYLNDEDKTKGWNFLKSLNIRDVPWLCFGDFNEILQPEKKRSEIKNVKTFLMVPKRQWVIATYSLGQTIEKMPKMSKSV